MNIMELIYSSHFVNKVSLVIILIVVLVAIRLTIGQILLKATKMSVDRKRKLFVNLNFFLTLFFTISMVVIWTDELKSLAISIAAIMVGLIVASKEFILNLLGGLFKIAQNAFHIGDRIEIDGVRGDVIDRSLLSTTLIEVGPGMTTHQLTGRSVIIPNSILLTKHVINESYLKNYVLHTFQIPLSLNSDWQRAEEILLERCQFYCADFFNEAQAYLNKLHQKSHLELPVLKPRVHVNIIEDKKIELIVRITAPAQSKGRLEQRIIKDFLREFYN